VVVSARAAAELRDRADTTIIASVLIFILFSFEPVNGGTVHFKGEVVNAACAVDAGSIDQTVQLGQVWPYRRRRRTLWLLPWCRNHPAEC
jgi:hypothetical protein